MEAPDYLNQIAVVAGEYGGLSDWNTLYAQLEKLWTVLEDQAKTYAYDILLETYPLVSMQALTSLLYRAPDAAPDKDVTVIREKDREYGGSWHKRGGQGAFFMLARKWDRIVEGVKKFGSFEAILAADKREEGVLDDLGDLRRYLVLVLSWHKALHSAQEEMPF